MEVKIIKPESQRAGVKGLILFIVVADSRLQEMEE